MVKNIELEQLVINKLTQAQYDALAVKNPGELYFVTDANITQEVETQLTELSKKVPEPISTYESFPEATAENVGMRVVYTGETIKAPSIENEDGSASTVFLDPYLTRGHTFMLVPVELSLDVTESITVYMWQDVNGAIPPIGDDTSGKMLSNNGITYEWTEVVSGEKLPDQTGNAGALLTTDGTNPQWTGFVGYAGTDNFGDEKYAIILDPANKQTSDYKTGHPRTAINPMGDTASFGTNIGGTASSVSSVSIGAGSRATNTYTVAVGTNATANGSASTAVGDGARATKSYSIQLGKGLNDTESTFSVGFGSSSYRLLEADGTIPAERMSSTAGTTGQILTKTDTGMEWQDSAGEGGGLDKAYTKLMVHVPTKEEFENGEIQQGALGYTFALPDGMEDGEYYFYITVLDRPRVSSTDEYPNDSSPINNYKDFIVDFALANGRIRFCSVRCGERAWYNISEWGDQYGGLDTDLHCFDVYTCNGRQVFFNRSRFVEGGLFEWDGWSGRIDTDVAAVTFSKVVNRNTKEEFAIENDEYMNYFHDGNWKYPYDFGWVEEGGLYQAFSIAPQKGLKDYIQQGVADSLSTLVNVYTPSDYYGYIIGIENLLIDNDRFDITVGDKIKFWINNAYDSSAWVIFEIDVLNKTYTQELINGGIDGINEFSVGIAVNGLKRQVVFYKGDRSEMIGFGEHQVYYQVQPNFFVNSIFFNFWWEDEYANYDDVEAFEFFAPVTPTDLDIVWGEITRINNQVGDISTALAAILGE